METVSEDEKTPPGPYGDEITLEQINKDIENINVECNKVNCNPILNVLIGIYRLIRHFLKCFKIKNE